MLGRGIEQVITQLQGDWRDTIEEDSFYWPVSMIDGPGASRRQDQEAIIKAIIEAIIEARMDQHRAMDVECKVLLLPLSVVTMMDRAAARHNAKLLQFLRSLPVESIRIESWFWECANIRMDVV